jgi:hypothetical protein
MDNKQIFSAMIPAATPTLRATIANTLERFGTDALEYASKRRIQVRPLEVGERYDEASPALARMGVDVDGWPAPPAGLFVVEERTVYIRSQSAMTIAHEFGHALDCALGGGVYRSGLDPKIRAAFAAAREYVTPYASTGLDEYMAESIRAYVEISDPASPWPPATRERLQRIDPTMYAIVEGIFAEMGGG